MKRFLEIFSQNRYLFLFYIPLILFGGIIGSFIGGTIVLSAIIIYTLYNHNYSYAICIFFLVFILGDNLSPLLENFKNLRFVAMGLLLLPAISRIKSSNLALKLLSFTFVALFSTIAFSNVMSEPILKSIAFILIAIIIFGIFKNYVLEDFEEFTHVFLVFILILYVVPIFLIFIPGINFSLFASNRYKGFMGNPNGLALISLMIYPLLDLFKEYNINNKKNIRIVQIIIIISVLLTYSRNGIISIIIYELLKYSVKKEKGAIFFISVIITGIVINMIDWVQIANDIGLQNYIRAESLSNASGRIIVWPVIIEGIFKSPFIGHGVYSEHYFLQEYADINNLTERYWGSVWNSYLVFLFDVGFIGTICYFYFLVKIYTSAKIKRLAVPFMIAVLFSAIFESWLTASLNAYTPLFYFYFAIQSGLKPVLSNNSS